MDMVKVEKLVDTAKGMSSMPFMRQIGIMFGLAMSIGIAVAIVLWSQEPNYSVLYSSLSPKDTSAIIDVFEAADLKYKVEHESGMLLVPSERLHEARMMLAESNLPQDTSIGFELIEKEQGFGTSNFIQNARYQRAVEGELAKTIKSMAAVDSARVHLALPKESAFIRDQREPGASVMLTLAQGWRLEEEQIQAIRHLVASSIPKMQPKNVTVVDAKGRLLSDDSKPNGMKLSAQQFEYTRKVETLYTSRIEQLMAPLVGKEKIQAQVSADLDFTVTETTQERFNPDLPAVRSEQNVEEESSGKIDAGIPGALTNQPPGVAEAPEKVNTDNTQVQQIPTKSRRQSTRNFELDKTISHTKYNTGTIKRLSIAVVVDNKVGKNAEGETISIPYTPEELARFSALVKEAVGFNALRGDTVNVSNVAFTPPVIEQPPVIPFWEKNWFWVMIKQVGVILLLLFLLFGFLRPMMRSLIAKAEEEEEEETKPEESGPPELPPPAYENNLQLAKAVAADDPKMVAQVVRTWIMADKKRGAA